MTTATRTVLALDWNGTVVDDASRALDALRAAIGTGLSAPRSLRDFRAGFRLPLASWFAHLGVPPGEREAVERRWNDELAGRPARLSPGAREMLESCADRAVDVYVITGAAADVVEADAARLGIRHLLHGIIGAAHPKAETLQRWLPRPVLYVGDTEYDIDQARAAGVVSVAFTRGYRPTDALLARDPDHLVGDLAEVVALLHA